MIIQSTLENYQSIRSELDYWIHYNCGVFKAKNRSCPLSTFNKEDLIWTSKDIFPKPLDSEIFLNDKMIHIKATDEYFLFLNGFNKEIVRKWIKAQVRNKEYLDDYVKYNYQTTLNRLNKYDLFEIILDYI